MGECGSKQSHSSVKGDKKEDENPGDVLQLIKRRPGHNEARGKPLLNPRVSGEPKYTIVLDIDECLLLAVGRGAKEKPVIHKRPFLEKFINGLNKLDNTEVVLWTSGSLLQSAIAWGAIDPNGTTISQVIWRTSKWVKEDPSGLVTDPSTGRRMRSFKDLSLLGRDVTRTVIVDNAPQNCVLQPGNCIIIDEYATPNPSDCSLQGLSQVLFSLVASGHTVPEFLSTSPLMRPFDIAIESTKQSYCMRKMKNEIIA
eukprot:TRINITY_DN771_c13_g1_i1.p1 TRINITY_DN771_c13_g1~~TRINITY_DN771_c13_g1_i1.p1  ORF type:complete len:280 (+),score=41.78 TRINITY_DN771_c13_g1_i1:78-842(+)